jgi:UDP-glucuronate decarboxylase
MQLAEEVIKACDSKSGFTYLALPADDPRQRKPDITRAQTALGWNPTIPLREGLKRTVDDFKARVNV